MVMVLYDALQCGVCLGDSILIAHSQQKEGGGEL
jgi:hypothetical protein